MSMPLLMWLCLATAHLCWFAGICNASRHKTCIRQPQQIVSRMLKSQFSGRAASKILDAAQSCREHPGTHPSLLLVPCNAIAQGV